MKLYRYIIILLFVNFSNVSCFPVNVDKTHESEIQLRGTSEGLFWNTIDQSSPRIQVRFEHKQNDFGYRIQSIKITDENFETTINDDVLNQKNNELFFVDTDISPVIWKVRNNIRTVKFNGGDGAGSFIISLALDKGDLEDYSILRRKLNP